jgi:hypothetical protein
VVVGVFREIVEILGAGFMAIRMVFGKDPLVLLEFRGVCPHLDCVKR